VQQSQKIRKLIGSLTKYDDSHSIFTGDCCTTAKQSAKVTIEIKNMTSGASSVSIESLCPTGDIDPRRSAELDPISRGLEM
jgi:hypothetical protein